VHTAFQNVLERRMYRLPDIDELDGLQHHGWTLRAELTREDGKPYRAEYEAWSGGRRVLLDWSPYQQFEPVHFRAMVELDFPRRAAIGSVAPLTAGDVEDMYLRGVKVAA
jgi:hypothetical protein